jgi:hypothetical protein
VHQVRVKDIGAGGAAVQGAPDLPTGSRVSLEPQDGRPAIEARVAGAGQGVLHLAFLGEGIDAERVRKLAA